MGAILNLDLFTVGVAMAAIAILGFVVFFNNYRSATNRTFLAFAIITILWSIANYVSYQFSSAIVSLWVLRFVIFIAVWYVFHLFSLFYIFPRQKASFPRWYLYGVIPWTAFVSLLTLTNFVFVRVTAFDATGHVASVENGPGIFIFGITVISLIIGAIFFLIKKFIAAKVAERTAYIFVIIGTSITFLLLIIFNFLLPAFFNNPQFIQYGALFILPFVAFTFYAIVRHQLLQVKIISTEIVAFLVTIVSFVEIILSRGIVEIVFRTSVFILLLIFSIFLIRSVVNEVKAREQIQKLAGQLKTLNKKLERADKVKTEFISIASHQLRTPLTIIKGYTSMALEGTFGRFTKDQHTMIEKLSLSANRLIDLVEDLLNISRLEQGRIEYEYKIMDIIPLVKGVVEELKPKAAGKGIALTFVKPARSIPHVRIDEQKMRQVFINLVDNAIKYTEQGSVTLTVKRDGDHIHIVSSDTGIGISKEDLSTLFKKFVRGSHITQMYTEGVGLGLYFARKVVENHGGKIWAESAGKGKGSVFTVELPMAS